MFFSSFHVWSVRSSYINLEKWLPTRLLRQSHRWSCARDLANTGNIKGESLFCFVSFFWQCFLRVLSQNFSVCDSGKDPLRPIPLYKWVLITIHFPKKCNNSCLHGAPLLTAFICKPLSEHMLNLQKDHFCARVSSARHVQSLQVGEELATYAILFWPCGTAGMCSPYLARI